MSQWLAAHCSFAQYAVHEKPTFPSLLKRALTAAETSLSLITAHCVRWQSEDAKRPSTTSVWKRPSPPADHLLTTVSRSVFFWEIEGGVLKMASTFTPPLLPADIGGGEACAVVERVIDGRSVARR